MLLLGEGSTDSEVNIHSLKLMNLDGLLRLKNNDKLT